MKVFQTLATLGATAFGVFLLAHWVAWAIWFLPAVLTLAALAKTKYPFRVFYPLMGLSLLCSGVWGAAVLSYGSVLPGALQWLLAIPLQPSPGVPEAGRFDPGPWEPEDLIGLTYLASAAGGVMVLKSAAFEATARMAMPAIVRVWALRASMLAIAGGGTWLLWRLQTGWHVLFGIVAYWMSLGFFTSRIDPKEELNEP
jgi:hypothetical protein